MATIAKWCVFGVLVLAGLTAGETETKCVLITLKSTPQVNAKEQILDDSGRPADIVSVVVVTRYSTVKCTLDDTVIISEPFVIAKKGCSAQFKVCYKALNEPDPTVRPGCILVRLLSRLNREAEETLDSKIISMKVVRRFIDGTVCDPKKNFGFRGKVAFANSGCRADFEVCLDDNPPTDIVCQTHVLGSTRTTPTERRITDSKGNTVAIISVDLLKQISTAVQCVEWRTFLYNDTHVVVKLGCEGRFKVCFVPSIDPETTFPTGCITVRLLSTQNNSARKKVAGEEDNIKSITLLKQFSEFRCVLNQNFGYKGADVFASGGCRGDFLVCIIGPNPPTDSPQTTCVNVLLASWSADEHDWKKVTSRSGQAVTIKSMRLVRQDSNDACIESRTFYISGSDEVHATKGCRGTFRVCYVQK